MTTHQLERIAELETVRDQELIAAAVRKAVRDANVLPTALPDVLAIAKMELSWNEQKQRVQDVQGQSVAKWLNHSSGRFRHWFPPSRGAGAGG